jgi:membrane protein DedA with SNARE-associated domain
VLAEIIALIVAYRYLAIFPIALFEAPLMSVVIGFFAATGDLNLFLAFGIVILGDFVGDTVLYVVGRWYRHLFLKVGPRLNLSPERVGKVLEYFGRHDRRAIVISKLVHGVGFTGLITAGSLRIPYRRFIVTCLAVSISQSAVLAALGMLSGGAYKAFAQMLGYFDIAVAAIILLGAFFLYRTLIAKIGDQDVKN